MFKQIISTFFILTIGQAVLADMCATQSRGFNFNGTDAQSVISSCHAHPSTSNSECDANVSCLGQASCSTDSRGLVFQGSNQSEVVSRCKAHPSTSNTDCEVHVRCQDNRHDGYGDDHRGGRDQGGGRDNGGGYGGGGYNRPTEPPTPRPVNPPTRPVNPPSRPVEPPTRPVNPAPAPVLDRTVCAGTYDISASFGTNGESNNGDLVVQSDSMGNLTAVLHGIDGNVFQLTGQCQPTDSDRAMMNLVYLGYPVTISKAGNTIYGNSPSIGGFHTFTGIKR